MDRRFQGTDSKDKSNFLVVDEFAALKFLWIKKEFNKSIFERIILMGRSANVHLLMAHYKSRNICN